MSVFLDDHDYSTYCIMFVCLCVCVFEGNGRSLITAKEPPQKKVEPTHSVEVKLSCFDLFFFLLELETVSYCMT